MPDMSLFESRPMQLTSPAVAAPGVISDAAVSATADSAVLEISPLGDETVGQLSGAGE
jgi:hypothetical protein